MAYHRSNSLIRMIILRELRDDGILEDMTLREIG